jgi:hypothetical protein
MYFIIFYTAYLLLCAVIQLIEGDYYEVPYGSWGPPYKP